ncbi:Ig-like domain-containing protein, partial [Asanoa siamensis]|uniref:Ig-like domain-containing protein n=1 Tax=Asanoa siamensis TaxID=926357 RepID=UPI0019445820
VLAVLATATLASALCAAPASAGGQYEPLLGDVNGDGRTDRATLVDLDADCGVDVELGQSGGGFGPATRYTWPDPSEVGYCPDMGVIVDLGGDGSAELLLAYFNGRTPGVESDIVVLEDFTPAGGFDAITRPSFIGLENFNTDNLTDVYEWTDDSDGVVTWLNTPSGQLVPGPVHADGVSVDFEFADFDRNGATDLVAGFDGASGTPANGAIVVLDDGERVVLRTDEFYDVDALDANGDHKLDVRAVNAYTDEVVHFIGNGRGAFTEAPNAVDDTVQVPFGTQKTISVLVNDAATTAATLRIVTPPRYGTIVRTTSKGFIYRNTTKRHDSFVYELTVDGKTDTATATLRIM